LGFEDQVSGVRFQVSGKRSVRAGNPNPYMKLQVKSEPQNIEYRMSKGGFVSLSHFL
jgi:hypothetical protein